jgi:hypothetical protein
MLTAICMPALLLSLNIKTHSISVYYEMTVFSARPSFGQSVSVSAPVLCNNQHRAWNRTAASRHSCKCHRDVKAIVIIPDFREIANMLFTV